MKGKVNAKTNNERRWSNHSRVCDHNFSCGWLCRITANYSSFSRGETNAVGSGFFSTKRSTKQLVSDFGSITAEFAMVLPAVLLILTLSLSALSVQAQRMNLIELSAIGSRALARGEGEFLVKQLLEQSRDVKYEISYEELMVCLKLSSAWEVFGLGSVPISEKQCSRKSGL